MPALEWTASNIPQRITCQSHWVSPSPVPALCKKRNPPLTLKRFQCKKTGLIFNNVHEAMKRFRRSDTWVYQQLRQGRFVVLGATK
jgi:hypothetical protein